MVRGYVAWALGKIGGGQARRVLETSRGNETSESVKKEIEAALAVV